MSRLQRFISKMIIQVPMMFFLITPSLFRFSSYWLLAWSVLNLAQNKIVLSKRLFNFFLILFFLAFFQIFILPVGADHSKNTLNLLGYIIITGYLYSRFRSFDFRQMFTRNLFIFSVLFVVVSAALIGPWNFMILDRNYTFGVINYHLGTHFFEKQFISQILTFTIFMLASLNKKNLFVYKHFVYAS